MGPAGQTQAGYLWPHLRGGVECARWQPRQLCPVQPQSLGPPKGRQGRGETGDSVTFPSQPGGLLGKFC